MITNLRIGETDFKIGEKTYIMGILNVTPDSFSDGGRFNQIEAALDHVREMIEDGADIIDIGGESTRPNHIQISEEEEAARVVPVIKAIKERYKIPVSIDTYKSKVAKAALEAGADLVNDVWGLKYDPNMANVIKEYNVPVCIMHNRENMDYDNFRSDMLNDLKRSIEIGEKAGINKEKIIIDPGIGFAKTYEMNLEAMNHLEDLLQFDMPILLAASRKSVIGLTLDLPVTEREEGTIATSVLGVMKGCHFVRVHNVKANLRAIRMIEAILHNEKQLK
ncbi:dihydropteroate synthase [Mobilisporobacter senegalensis]|uniref:Dihydropteroate synthase n=1 Tax=Mobilisporobacter senegalensis TaxID=1329262 RepID=A0A3N1XN83_9FIRM|nr:dihydropteroate synthase [Mobilisporobacter senegalensis]ROR28153.1 dihydropteroate synthase [Mobilisporobacter senegalensis]